MRQGPPVTAKVQHHCLANTATVTLHREALVGSVLYKCLHISVTEGPSSEKLCVPCTGPQTPTPGQLCPVLPLGPDCSRTFVIKQNQTMFEKVQSLQTPVPRTLSDVLLIS